MGSEMCIRDSSIGCVFRASIIKLSEKYILKRLDDDCALAFFYHQNIVLCIAKLNGLNLYSSPIVLGGYRPEGPQASNFVDSKGNSYRSLAAGFNKYIGMRTFYQDMLAHYADSQMYEELKALSKFHNLSLYGVIDDAVTFSAEVDEEKIEKQLMKLAKRSEKDGSAIGIGHVKPKTLNVLSDQIPRLKKMGYKFEFVSNMLH